MWTWFYHAVATAKVITDGDGCRTYDEYSSELLSGHLSWTPVHESELFWKENATKLNDKNYEQLKYVLPQGFAQNTY